jgi:hypothetical protein
MLADTHKDPVLLPSTSPSAELASRGMPVHFSSSRVSPRSELENPGFPAEVAASSNSYQQEPLRNAGVSESHAGFPQTRHELYGVRNDTQENQGNQIHEMEANMNSGPLLDMPEHHGWS